MGRVEDPVPAPRQLDQAVHAATTAVEDPVKKFACPVLLVRGGNTLRGRIVSPETAAEAREIYPALEVVTFDEAGHNVRREAYDGYVAAVRSFLLRNS